MTESSRGLPVKAVIRLKGARKVMAQAMQASVDNAALSQVNREIDVTALQALQQTLAVNEDQAVSLNTLMMAAVARTLPQHPIRCHFIGRGGSSQTCCIR